MVMKGPDEAQSAHTSGNTADVPEENNIEEMQAYTTNPLTSNKASLPTYFQLLEWNLTSFSLVVVKRVV